MSRHLTSAAATGATALLVFTLSGSGTVSGPSASSVCDVPPHPSSTNGITTDFADYIWPTDAGRIITSVFAEYRAMHFHGGIDISTGDRTGLKTFAMRDGYVSRVRINATGYGKMLFITHSDGYTTTYAHLSKFAGVIEERARQEQMRRGSYVIDLSPPPGSVPVKKGEIIAYTGDTGTGSEHLHVEIRDPHMEPINPQLCPQIRTEDHMPPVLRQLAVTPLGEQSTVNGEHQSRVVLLRPTGASHYRAAQTFVIQGECGFAIEARDRVEGSRFQRGLYRYDVFVDGTWLGATTLNRAPLLDAQLIGLYYDWHLRDLGKGRFEKLYADPSGALPFYSPPGPSSGIISSAQFTHGVHTFKIVAQDIAGNSCDLEGRFASARRPTFSVEQSSPAITLNIPDPECIERIIVSTVRNGGTWEQRETYPFKDHHLHQLTVPIPRGECDAILIVAEDPWAATSLPHVVYVRPIHRVGTFRLMHAFSEAAVTVSAIAEGIFTSSPTVHVIEGGVSRTVAMSAVDPSTFVGTIFPREGCGGSRRIVAEGIVNGTTCSAVDSFEVYPLTPGRNGSYAIDENRLRVDYDSLSVYKPVLMRIERGENGSAYDLQPATAVLHRGITVTVQTAEETRGLGLYFKGRGAKEIITTAPSSLGRYTGKVTRTLGILSLETDDIPPSAAPITIRTDGNRRLFVSFHVGDNRSGVEYESLKLYIDDSIVIPEIDGEHHRVFYRSGDPLERGSHRLVIRLNDCAGNIGTVERRFTVR